MGDRIKKFRLGKTDSIKSVNKEYKLPIELTNTSKAVSHLNKSTTVDAHQVYLDESAKSNKYRLLFTVYPYCSNILFNTCTEIVRNEGSNKTDNNSTNSIQVASDNIGVNVGEGNNPKILGLTGTITRRYMVKNTEYSREVIGFEYHPGYDIFNNHILRNLSFRMINDKVVGVGSVGTPRNIFNTIEDVMRWCDNTDSDNVKFENVKFSPRTDGNVTEIVKHMYEHSNCLMYGNFDAINYNLREENGWFGFKNNSTISAVDKYGNDLDISHTINNRENCEFIDMYPDRTLFSFTPKLNKFRHRLEYNWDVCLTYPKENFYGHPIVKSNDEYDNGRLTKRGTKGLLLQDIKLINNPNGDKCVMFRSHTKHGLHEGDTFILMVDKSSNDYVECKKECLVTGIGNFTDGTDDYFFYMNDTSILDEIIELTTIDGILGVFYTEVTPQPQGNEELNYKVINGKPDEIPFDSDFAKGNDCFEYGDKEELIQFDGKYYKSKGNIDLVKTINNKLEQLTFRFCRYYGGNRSEYYIRKFHKIPNWKFANEKFTEWHNENDFDNFIGANAMKNGRMRLFDSEIYPMAFGKTIYGDDVTQIMYTDDVDISNLTDNLNRPVTDVYLTIIKRNAGHKEWYKYKNYGDDKVEFSHCFSDVYSGFEFFNDKKDDSETVLKKKCANSDIRYINYTKKDNGDGDYLVTNGKRGKSIEEINNDTKSITIDDDSFYGDVVEFIPAMAMEQVLSDVCFRFNTAQREGEFAEGDFNFQYDEIEFDDYDLNTLFSVISYETTKKTDIVKPEGYYYKPHYKVRLREFSETVNNQSHRTLFTTSAQPYVTDRMYIKVNTSLPHNVFGGQKLWICDNNVWYESYVVDVLTPLTFVCTIVEKNSQAYIDWVLICKKINDGTIDIRVNNDAIPSYARNIDINQFVWRDVIKSSDLDRNRLEEYPFTNGAFYAEKQINFYLKRQDPEGLYSEMVKSLSGEVNVPSDVLGNIKKKGKHIYKEITAPIC